MLLETLPNTLGEYLHEEMGGEIGKSELFPIRNNDPYRSMQKVEEFVLKPARQYPLHQLISDYYGKEGLRVSSDSSWLFIILHDNLELMSVALIDGEGEILATVRRHPPY